MISIETQENVNEYHTVFANTITSFFNAVLGNRDKDAKKLLINMIEYAYTMAKEDEDSEIECHEIFKEVQALKLDDKNLDELTVMMAYYQSKAGMKPVQTRNVRAAQYQRIRNRL